MQKYLIKDITIVNERTITQGDVLIQNGRIEKIGSRIEPGAAREIDGSGKYLLPGAIDDQVHFREPGLTHKANIFTESRAAVAGGVTSFMEMPNTSPPRLYPGIAGRKIYYCIKDLPRELFIFHGYFQ